MNAKRIGRVALATALGAALAACGSAKSPGPGGGGNTGTTIAALDFCTGVADLVGQKSATCQGATAAWVAQQKALATGACQAAGGEITAGRVAYDGTRGGSCLAELTAMSCTEFFAKQNSGHGLFTSTACAAAIGGAVAAGSTCYDDSDCRDGYCQLGAGSACPGTCTPHAAVGQSCATARCGPGLECDRTDPANPTCKAASAENGACPCDDGLYCDTSGPSPVCKPPRTGGPCSDIFRECAVGYACTGPIGASTCLPLGKVGDACTPGTGGCAPGLDCDPATSRCVAQPTAGQTCTSGAGSLSCLDGVCDDLGTGQCKAPKADGAPCDPRAFVDDCLGLCDASTLKCRGATLSCTP